MPNNVDAKAVGAFTREKSHHLVHRRLDGGISPVEIWLTGKLASAESRGTCPGELYIGGHYGIAIPLANGIAAAQSIAMT